MSKTEWDVVTIKVEGKGKDIEQSSVNYDSHLSILQFHIQEVKVSENSELLLTGRVVQRVLSGSALL